MADAELVPAALALVVIEDVVDVIVMTPPTGVPSVEVGATTPALIKQAVLPAATLYAT